MVHEVSAREPAMREPAPGELVAYVEQMLLELAELASVAGETALAASLALTAIQAGAARVRGGRPPVSGSSRSPPAAS